MTICGKRRRWALIKRENVSIRCGHFLTRFSLLHWNVCYGRIGTACCTASDRSTFQRGLQQIRSKFRFKSYTWPGENKHVDAASHWFTSNLRNSESIIFCTHYSRIGFRYLRKLIKKSAISLWIATFAHSPATIQLLPLPFSRPRKLVITQKESGKVLGALTFWSILLDSPIFLSIPHPFSFFAVQKSPLKWAVSKRKWACLERSSVSVSPAYWTPFGCINGSLRRPVHPLSDCLLNGSALSACCGFCYVECKI